MENITDLTIIPSSYYYRWSTPGQVKETHYDNNKLVIKEKEEMIKQTIEQCVNTIDSYKGFCSVCNKEIRLQFVDHGFLDKGKTGRTIEREDIQNLLEEAKNPNSFRVVITPYSSRLGRRASTTATIRDQLKDLGVQIYSISQPIPIKCPGCFDPMDDDSAVITESISDIQSQLELSAIRRYYKKGMPIRIKQGKPAGSLGFGLIKKYDVVGKDPRGNDILTAHYEWSMEKVAIINRIAKDFLNGAGTWRIARDLNTEGISSPQGKLWGRSTILVILKNPLYAGLIRFRWKISKNGKRIIQPQDKWMLEKACFSQIWSMDYFNKVQEELERRHTMGGRATSSSALLIGLLKCGYCQYSMYQTKTNSTFKSGVSYVYLGYSCGTFMHKGMCQSNGVMQEIVDKKILQEVGKLLNDSTKQAYFNKAKRLKRIDLEKELVQNKQALRKVTSEFERCRTAYQQGVDTLDEYSHNKNKYEPLLGSITHKGRALEEELQRLENVINLDTSYADALKRFKEIPNQEDKKIVQVILRRIIDRIEIKKFTRKSYSVKIIYKII